MAQLYSEGHPLPHDMNDIASLVSDAPHVDKKEDEDMKVPCATRSTRARRGEATDLHSISERVRTYIHTHS